MLFILLGLKTPLLKMLGCSQRAIFHYHLKVILNMKFELETRADEHTV